MEVKYEITGDAEKLKSAAKDGETALKSLEGAAGRAGKAIDKTEDASKKAGDTLGSLKKIAGGIGFGGMANDAEDLATGLAGIGVQGAVAAGGLALIAGTAIATYKVVDALYDLSLALEDTDEKLAHYYEVTFPGFTRASDEALQASSGLSATTEILGDVTSQVGVIIAQRVAPAFDELARITATGALAALEALDAYEKWWDGIKANISTTFDAITAGSQFRKDLEQATGVTSENRKQIDKLIETKQILAQVDEVNAKLQVKAKEAEQEHAKATREQEKAQREATRAAEERARAEEQLAGLLNGLFTQFLDPLQKIDEKYDAIADKVSKLGASESDLAEVELARHMAKMEYIDEEAAKEEAQAAKREEEAAKLAEENAKKLEQQKKAATELADHEIAERKRANQVALDGAMELLSLAEEHYQAQVDSIQGLSEAGQKAALRAFKLQKAAAIAQIVMNTAQAVMQAAASAPPPANLIPIGLAAALGAAQLGKAASAKPPSFHTGGMAPDEQMVVRNNERVAVLTRQGQQAIGGEHGLARINRGESAPSEVRVINQYQHRVFGTFVQDNVAMTNSPLRRALKRGDRVGRRTR